MTGVGYKAAGGWEEKNKMCKVKCKYISSNKIRRIENAQAVEGTAAELRPMQEATPIIKWEYKWLSCFSCI